MKAIRLTSLDQPAEATINVPGSKSYTNRALLLAAMTPGSVKLINPLMSDDTRAMIACLEQLGITVKSGFDVIEVVGSIADIKDGDYELGADLSGTTMRFMLALSAVIPGRQTLRGGPGLHKRPVGVLVTALRQLGATIDYLEQEGFPPLRVASNSLKTSPVRISGAESSQYLSALLMVAPIAGGLTLEIEGEPLSKPYIDMTVETMRHFGVAVTTKTGSYQVTGQQIYSGSQYVIEGDVSSASYFLAIAALTRSTFTLKNLNPQSHQADMGFLKILEDMGNELVYAEDSITIKGHGVRPVKVDMRDCPDQAQTLAVLAACADGQTTMTGIQSLRIKETERIAALEQELKKMGIETASTQSTLTVVGGQPQAATIGTHGDHRMAMAFAVAGSQLSGMVIEEPEVVGKTFPAFWEELARTGIGVERTEL
jgi:3-phosphoshikimate 1-carboxyvinyltransferase